MNNNTSDKLAFKREKSIKDSNNVSVELNRLPNFYEEKYISGFLVTKRYTQSQALDKLESNPVVFGVNIVK